jgi:CHAT domain-containing protein/tetratricopeptide (TPR) repeat protein
LASLCLASAHAEEAQPAADAAPADGIDRVFAAFKAGNCKAVLELAGGIALSDGDPSLSDLLQVKGICQKRLGRLKDAEQTYRAALDRLERLGQGETVGNAIALDNLGNLYMESRRLAEAEPLRLRAIEIFRKSLPPAHPHIVTASQNLAVLYQFAGRRDEARRYYGEALAGAEKAYGADATQVGIIADNFAGFLRASGDKPQARELYLRAIGIFEKSLGADHPDTALALQNYAIFLGETGETVAAEEHLKRAIDIGERLYGPRHSSVAAALNTLALQQIEARRWPEAQATTRRAAEISVALAQAGADFVPSEDGQRLSPFRRLVQAAFADGAGMGDPALADEAFRAAQRALDSPAAEALRQLAARFSGGDAGLARLLRESQDLAKEQAARDRALLASVIRPAASRDMAEEVRLRGRLAAIAARQAEIAATIAAGHPQYRALTGGEPLGIARVQALLKPSEALVQFLDVQAVSGIDETSFVWVVTPDSVRWLRLPLGTAALTRRVAELRCGLDLAAAADERCARLRGNARDGAAPDAPRFDTALAHDLYKALLGATEDMISGRELLIVASGALGPLPFQVLTTAPSEAGDLGRAPWLIRRHALTVLPSAAALQALRGSPRVTRADKAYAGFANPLLEGSNAEAADLARQARAKTRCESLQAAPRAKPEIVRRGLALPARARLADGAFVRAQVPLPETADEVCAVAGDLGASAADAYLAERASETTVKEMSAAGDLARYRIVHFATHGALAGQIAGSAEPGLILTPPAATSATNDGYLSAPEIAELKLDAELVILSACNTAAGGAEGGEALSGMARAFFYAGARSVLASHWAVDSAATVKLITRAAREIRAAPALGRAAALRRSMLAMIDEGETVAHPAQWAPFVLVGEGAGEAAAATASAAPARPDPKAGVKAVAKIGKLRRKDARDADWKSRIFAP